jgi:hypothetical protein
MYDLGTFAVEEKVAFARSLRECGGDATDFASAADCIVRFFFENLVDADASRPACALVRLYRTYPFEALDDACKAFARRTAGGRVSPRTRCLTLAATAGVEEDWNHVERSVGHRSIPLPSAEIVEESPMIAQLIRQLGLDLDAVVDPRLDLIADLAQKEYNLFYVPIAEKSPYIPAQEFVERYGVKSALGFGGLLPTGDLFAVVLFARVRVSKEVAMTFRTFALTVKSILLMAELA